MKTMLYCPCAEIPEDKEPTWRLSETITIIVTACYCSYVFLNIISTFQMQLIAATL